LLCRSKKAPHDSEEFTLGDELMPLLKHCQRQSTVHYNTSSEWAFRCPIALRDAILAALKRRGFVVQGDVMKTSSTYLVFWFVND
jgi:hypothetical protein